jgi:hypothetical protein
MSDAITEIYCEFERRWEARLAERAAAIGAPMETTSVSQPVPRPRDAAPLRTAHQITRSRSDR